MNQSPIFTLKKNKKTYYSLIMEAINESSDGKLKISEIYSYIIETYPQFNKDKKRWQNSIRHALSSKKSFVKTLPKLKSSIRGSLWSINRDETEKLPRRKKNRYLCETDQFRRMVHEQYMKLFDA